MSAEHKGLQGPAMLAGTSAVRAAVGDTLLRARALLQRRETAAAQRLYQGVLLIDPDNVEALHLLGVACLQAGDAKQAEPLIVRSLKLGLGRAWNIANHGAVLVALGRYAEALAVLDKALQLDANCAPALLALGNALLALGRWPEAQAAYEQALANAPGLPEAWCNRGKVLRALNRPADAMISFDRALRLEPANDEARTHRGHALRDLGRTEEALRSYQLALVARPKAPELLALCGSLLTDLGRDLEALGCLDEALLQRPNDVQLLYQSCVALDRLHSHADLLTRCDRLLALAPDHPVAWLARGNALQGLHRYPEAVEAYGNAVARDPSLTDAWRNHASALRMLGRYADALDDYDRALAKTGANAELLYNRAATLQQLGHYDEALTSYEAAALVPAETAQALYSQAMALQQLRRDSEALACYRQARETDPNHGIARRSEAFCRLLTGDFAQGWLQHESRWSAGDTIFHRRYTDRPMWLGAEPVTGKTVLLHAEQGFGDTLQFCRYAPLVAALGATVVLEVPLALKPLLGSLRGVDLLVAQGGVTPPFDLHCPLMSLPLAFATNLDTIPAEVPYLQADPGRRQAWRQRLDEVSAPGRFRVGLAWSGNPRHNNDENRSILLEHFAPLYGLDATFISLQPLVRERDKACLAQSGIVNLGAELSDFADTAALIDALDLVICVDTSVAHLAGALGRPLWVLLPRVPDWRWLLDRDDSPWYPTAHLFRQDKPGDWPATIGNAAQALSGWIAEKRAQR
ncbi:tetratricopeptide repeat protein [Paraburkholderia phenazinium]|uniref:Tetratricopeptide (TPR) repeat n=1 Tax=Paraburkholderia phenazinium TaxID=60549 RepID=A0A1N6GQ94_9BURK|nr:tetratricopeptide repeat protein [Paraburkholderia phenazinium]SIO09632.1 Tetratricopeptide (TPR) repeat [Paraburkholderia phenazinium]